MHLLRKLVSLLALVTVTLTLIPCASVTAADKPLTAGRPKDEAVRTEPAKRTVLSECRHRGIGC